jgi:LPPG:FO 2-phospho-L-lactate transferase
MPVYNSNVDQPFPDNVNVVVLAGGVGGAKLADGFAQILPAGQLTVIVNTGDDFQHLGLTICPDLDTVTYTLAGEANRETGWGRAGETWLTIDEVQRLGGPDWFRLGDLDLATHLVRSGRMNAGSSLTEVTQHLCRHFGVIHGVLPMSDDPAPTMIESEEGMMPFQRWFVEMGWQPAVKEIHLPEDVRATPSVLWSLEKADVVVIAPSNPFVSIDPILNVYPIRAMVTDLPEAVVAVSPIVGGEALKGPAAKLMRELGMAASAQNVARYYDDLIDVFVYDQLDEGRVHSESRELLCTDTIMRDRADRVRLAREIVSYTTELVKQ